MQHKLIQMDKLLNLGFRESARAEIINNQFQITISRNEYSRNILYVFVIKSGDDISNWHIRYIGHSRKSFRNRMYGYQQGNGQAVNNRIHIEMRERCINGEEVIVYCLPDLFNMQLHDLHIDVAAGLEYSLINYYVTYNVEYNHPSLQNIAGNPNYNLQGIPNVNQVLVADRNEEEQEYLNNQVHPGNLPVIDSFNQVLGVTYWNHPFINIPTQLSNYFGETGETVEISVFVNETRTLLFTATINREANTNNSPRLYMPGDDGHNFQDWKRSNFNQGDSIPFQITGVNQLTIQLI
jgi:hypothetical protein